MARTVVPVADLRLEPVNLNSHDFSHNNLRASQLLFNETVNILEKKQDWVRVAACEQLCFQKQWRPYEGWLHCSEIDNTPCTPRHVIVKPFQSYSYGTFVEQATKETRPLNGEFNRATLIEDAKLFLDAPYLWGGRASFLPHQIASVDCSGLINLLYRGQGVSLPRDAHDQFLFGTKVATPLPGDLLYLAKEKRMHHVVMKIDANRFIEAPETGKCVRYLTWAEDLWEQDGRIYFRDRDHSYQGVYISFESRKEKVYGS